MGKNSTPNKKGIFDCLPLPFRRLTGIYCEARRRGGKGKANRIYRLPAGYTTGGYAVGVLIGGQYVWGDAVSEYLTDGLTSTVAVGGDWIITGTDKLKKGLKIAVRAVVYDPVDGTIVAAKSAMQKITVK